MKVIGFDNREYSINFEKYCKKQPNSKLSQNALELLKEIFPFDPIAVEVRLLGSKRQFSSLDLYADFVIPNQKIVVEVDGRQHTNYASFFHNSKLNFYQSQRRDRDKEEWCQINGFTLVRLKYNEPREKWTEKLLS